MLPLAGLPVVRGLTVRCGRPYGGGRYTSPVAETLAYSPAKLDRILTMT